jgi:hypothetical protein
MRLYCKAAYHNSPAGLHFDAPGIIEVDDWKAEFLLRDAPDNFSRELPPEESKSMDGPPQHRMVKFPKVRK